MLQLNLGPVEEDYSLLRSSMKEGHFLIFLKEGDFLDFFVCVIGAAKIITNLGVCLFASIITSNMKLLS